MTADPRLDPSRLLQISHPGRSPKIAGVAPEGSKAVLVNAIKALFAELSSKNTGTHEINLSTLLPSEKAARLAPHRSGALDAYKVFRREKTRESARIERANRDAFPLRRGNELSASS